MKLKTSLLLGATLLAALAPAHAITLDFGSGPAAPAICAQTGRDGLGPATDCTNGLFVSQSYGDVAGVVDIGYASPQATEPTGLRWWGPDYNTLFGVLYAGEGSDTGSLARIEIKALAPDAVVTLSGFDLGAWSQTTRGTTVNVYAIGGGAPLYTFAGDVGQGADSATPFSVNVSAAGGLWIEWSNSAYNVGIDNLQYSVSSVPEPGSAAMLLAGALMGLRLLRRPRVPR